MEITLDARYILLIAQIEIRLSLLGLKWNLLRSACFVL